MSDTPTLETDEATLTEQFLIRDLPLSVVAAASQRFERKLNAALAANAELLERLQEARESHLIATAKKVQTIQQQAVEIDRLKSVLADIYSLSRS
jgi:hypothetical protein